MTIITSIFEEKFDYIFKNLQNTLNFFDIIYIYNKVLLLLYSIVL